MTLYPFELQANLIQLIMLVVMTIWFAFFRKEQAGLTSKLFFWGLVSHVLMNIYWTTMIVVDGSGNYATFTACDTATVAFFTIWTSMFDSKIHKNLKEKKTMIPFFICIFGVWNCVWWNLWTGRIFINLIWGIVIILLSYRVAYCLVIQGAISKLTQRIWIFLTVILAIFQVPVYVYENAHLLHIVGDWICAAVWFGIIVICSFLAYKNRPSRTPWLFAAMIYSLYAQYLTDGVIYTIFVMVETVVLFMLIVCFDEKQIGLDKQKEDVPFFCISE